jgi:hypothetical protein
VAEVEKGRFVSGDTLCFVQSFDIGSRSAIFLQVGTESGWETRNGRNLQISLGKWNIAYLFQLFSCSKAKYPAKRQQGRKLLEYQKEGFQAIG